MKEEFFYIVAKSGYLSKFRLVDLAMIAIEFSRLGLMKGEYSADVSELYESVCGRDSER